MLLTLRYQESAQRPACAAFLRGPDPAAWLREIGRWGLAAGQLSCYLVPESIRSVQLVGLFVVVKNGELPADVLEPYGVVASRLYVPVRAALWPATASDELSAALLWPRQLLHPAIGMVGFDTTDEINLAGLLDCGPPRPTAWDRARPGVEPKPRLERVRVLAPTVAEVVESIQEEVGTVPLAQLPGLTEDQPGPAQAAWDNLRRRLLKAVLAVVRWLPGLPTGRVMRVLGLVILVVMALALLFSVFSQLGSGNLSGLIVPLTILAVRIWRSFSEKEKSRPASYRPTAPARPGMFQRMENWLGGRIHNLEQKRQNEIERLLRLFGENMDEALKYAIPLGGPYQNRGAAPESARLGPRATNFNLGGLGGGGRVDVWNLDAYRDNLRQQYLAAARQEVEAGRHKKAAYIHAHLLGDYHSAASVLEQGGYYREAAALYKDHLNNRPAAAKCLENGGLLLEAADLYAELKEHEKAGDLHQKLDQPALAARHYERGVALFLDNTDHPAAARLLADKLADPGRAQAVLLQGWASPKQPETCLKQYFDVLAAGSDEDLSAHVRDIYQHHTPAARRVPLLQVLTAVNARYTTPELRAASLEVAYEVVSTEASAGNVSHLALLRNFLPDDRLIAADCSRYVSSASRPAADSSKTGQVIAPQLDATISWQSAVAHGHQWVAIGWRDKRLHLARGNWYGNVEYYSWMTDVSGIQVLLMADEQHGNRILLRTSAAVALETKQLPKNKYFPHALVVESPSWLPPWPIRIALLPEGKLASAQIRSSFIHLIQYSAQGKAEGPFLLTHEIPDLKFDEDARMWPSELLYRNGMYYTYWEDQLVQLTENSQRMMAYETPDGGNYMLVRSLYSAKLCLAIATGEGFLLWEPTTPPNKPGPVFSTDSMASNMQFVGPEHLVTTHRSAITEQHEAVLYYYTIDEIQPMRTIKTSSEFVAVLPTISRQKFALLEDTGRISLHSISESEE
ncbi:hypothetical protein [Hymenobacter negativus]|uniref:MoxR-vWA-beta-propeller ternary system domain-containing protein n=1 Tax=Hymenobacter negativus TaxID=2795026 RepID=A0ABS3QG97_9BACT|nr:hypothetical protein [Hymenobacter negativus]MBO2010279.1 hypothetical protein [Hymenobacter negativus]